MLQSPARDYAYVLYRRYFSAYASSSLVMGAMLPSSSLTPAVSKRTRTSCSPRRLSTHSTTLPSPKRRVVPDHQLHRWATRYRYFAVVARRRADAEPTPIGVAARWPRRRRSMRLGRRPGAWRWGPAGRGNAATPGGLPGPRRPVGSRSPDAERGRLHLLGAALRDRSEKAGRVGFARRTPQGTLAGVEQIEPLHRAGYSYVAEAPLLIQFLKGIFGPAMGEDIFFQAGENGPVLQPLALWSVIRVTASRSSRSVSRSACRQSLPRRPASPSAAPAPCTR